jgi:DNA-binding response OmpR family regulator
MEPITKTVNDLLEAITEKDQADVSPFQNADEAVQNTRQFVPCMLVLCIQTNNDIPPVLNILKKLKPDIKQGLVKTLLVSKIKNPQLQKLIGEFGVTDYIEEPIPARTLMFKANLQLKAVDTTRRQIELKKQGEEKIVFKTSKKGEEEAQNTGTEIKTKSKPALALANDTFLIKNSQVKKQAKKYLVELDGPDPSTGDWMPEGDDPANPQWRWKPHDKEDEPGSEDGDGWVASGEKPQFKPAAKKWQLSSEKPSLYFKKKKEKVAEKIGVDEDGEVVVADDSPAAEENLRKNLKKAERIKKKKQAEAAGIPFVEEEEIPEPAPAPAPDEDLEEKETDDPIVKARKKKKRERAAAIARGETPPPETDEEESAAEIEPESPATAARQKLEKLRKAKAARKKEAVSAGLPVDPADEETAPPPRIESSPYFEDTGDIENRGGHRRPPTNRRRRR